MVIGMALGRFEYFSDSEYFFTGRYGLESEYDEE